VKRPQHFRSAYGKGYIYTNISSFHWHLLSTYRWASGSSVTFCASLTSAASPVGSNGYPSSSFGNDWRWLLWCSWACQMLALFKYANHDLKSDETYKRNSAVCAPADLGLVHVDEDPWVAERTAASVARYDTLICPANGLLVDELHGRVWAGLNQYSLANVPQSSCTFLSPLFTSPKPPNFPLIPQYQDRHTWSSIMLCSNLGPLIATSRGC
jgi:hypothetical protein